MLYVNSDNAVSVTFKCKYLRIKLLVDHNRRTQLNYVIDFL